MSIFIGSFIYVDNSLRPTITVLAETKAIELANRSINKAVGGIVKDKIDYSDLIYTKLDSKGKIYYCIHTNRNCFKKPYTS